MKKLVVICILFVVLGSFAACSPGRAVVTERQPHRVVVIPPQPAPGYIWRNNAWKWGGGRRFYRPNKVIIAPYNSSYYRNNRPWNRY